MHFMSVNDSEFMNNSTLLLECRIQSLFNNLRLLGQTYSDALSFLPNSI